ncbi:hypothetical protein BDP81DRAFT_179432 [Colletotrichum phormii]|uniref:Uncharacterized protein n=1 Tax=Colletotrichum phormii TaxID=359342 RepID=A0AAI9ZWN7_9PEZI|nr:uncharacterized protein BDP81DRAFT_179432 [Colletotrichum phormii]KAK1639556.1 hypothetical protein BDP81DRAFT_179432 [Colletotrichum phormii]
MRPSCRSARICKEHLHVLSLLVHPPLHDRMRLLYPYSVSVRLGELCRVWPGPVYGHWPSSPGTPGKRRWEQGITMTCGTISFSEVPRRGRVVSLATLIYLRHKPYKHRRRAFRTTTLCFECLVVSKWNGRDTREDRVPNRPERHRPFPSIIVDSSRKR